MARVHFGTTDGLDYLVGHVAGCKHLTITTLETLILVGGDHNCPITTVTRYDDGLA